MRSAFRGSNRERVTRDDDGSAASRVGDQAICAMAYILFS